MMLGMINASGICSIGTARDRVPRAMATLQSSPASPDRGATHADRRKHGGNEVTVFVIMAAILDRELQERDVFSIGGADCEAIIRRVVADGAALANESLTAPLKVEMIEQEPGSR
jgi:hypothetical protein